VLEVEGYGLEPPQNVESDNTFRIQELEVAHNRVQTKSEMLWKAGISQRQPNWEPGSQDTSLRHVDGNGWVVIQRRNGFLRKYCENGARVDQQRPATPVYNCVDVNQVILRLEWENPGVVSNEPIGALAHLGLGRAYAIQGEMAKSRAACADFFASWKNADRGIPRLAEAKAEYSNLP
jgi:hypothetical protein